jgi:chromosome segregation ATPase
MRKSVNNISRSDAAFVAIAARNLNFVTTMSEAEVQLKRIQDKLQQLVKQQAVLQKENAQLKAELGQSKDQASSHQKNVDNLKQQVDILRYNAGEMNEAEKKDFEKRINTYLKEIDRCIALLSE